MRVAKLAIEDMIPVIIPHARVEPWDVFPCLTIGPRPLALTTAQMKKATPAMGTTIALAVKRCLILCTGNQIAGREHSQKMKNDKKKSLVVPDPGIPFFMSLN